MRVPQIDIVDGQGYGEEEVFIRDILVEELEILHLVEEAKNCSTLGRVAYLRTDFWPRGQSFCSWPRAFTLGALNHKSKGTHSLRCW